MLPKVSAYCPTYGRPHVLEEAIESFLRQDYIGEKELVILNDYSGHTLHFDHPEVKIYNIKDHIKPLGKKFNETIKLCTGDILFAWEDDDIFLPHRFSVSVQKILKSGKNMYHTQETFIAQKDGFVRSTWELYKEYSLFHSALAIKKDFFYKANGYFEDHEYDSILFDQITMGNFFNLDNYKSENKNLHEAFYIYRHGVTDTYNTTSFSGWASVNGQLSLGAEVYLEQNKHNIPQGDYYLRPHWKHDYVENVKAYMKNYDGH